VSHNDPTDVSAYTAADPFPVVTRGGRPVPDNLARCQCCGTVGCCEVEAAFEAGRGAGAIGRGSRARYRRAVVDYVHEQERQAARCAAQGGLRVIYRDCLHRDHTESMKRIAGRHARAAARARRILATLDGQP
jgi:hypothetical protein